MGRSNELYYTFWPSSIVIWSSIYRLVDCLNTLCGVSKQDGDDERIRAQQVDGEILSQCDRQGTEHTKVVEADSPLAAACGGVLSRARSQEHRSKTT
jgi:hypothetical protein